MLQQTLDEEKQADQKLTEIAQQILGEMNEGSEGSEEMETEASGRGQKAPRTRTSKA